MDQPQMGQPTPTALPADTGSTAKIVYILYLISLVTGVTALIGLIMAYLNEGEAPDWVKTHYRLQIRTFWIFLLYCVGAFLLSLAVIGVVVWPLLLVWFIVRCVKGLQSIGRGQPYPKPASWLW